MKQFGFNSSSSYSRLHSIGHQPGCTCELCWVRVERAILRYYPGFLPEETADPRINELQHMVRKQREEIHWLRKELERSSVQKTFKTTSDIQIVCKVDE